jgi:hypothetical protein
LARSVAIWNKQSAQSNSARGRDHIVVALFVQLPARRIHGVPHNQPRTGKIMRRLLAAASAFASSPTSAIITSSLISLTTFSILPAQALPAGILHEPLCAPERAFAPAPVRESSGDLPCLEAPPSASALAEARGYLVDTATPGYTMSRQGPVLAIERLHPEFAIRLADAIREARASGLPEAGIFSAYRPPAFGVGGFSDKFNSLHSYGLAVDLTGIGGPGSAEAQRWHAIAAKHGVICPYGWGNRAEWNHCQPTSIKIVLAQNELRETISADGPRDLEAMFEAGNAMLQSPGSASETAAAEVPVHPVANEVRRTERRRESEERGSRNAKSNAKNNGSGNVKRKTRLAVIRHGKKDDDDDDD